MARQMAHAMRDQAWLPPQPLAPRAKALRPPVSAPTPELPPDRRPTFRPPSRPSGIQASRERPGRRETGLGECVAEEVVADLSNDPRHDR
jgi:hypothetical protein